MSNKKSMKSLIALSILGYIMTDDPVFHAAMDYTNERAKEKEHGTSRDSLERVMRAQKVLEGVLKYRFKYGFMDKGVMITF